MSVHLHELIELLKLPAGIRGGSTMPSWHVRTHSQNIAHLAANAVCFFVGDPTALPEGDELELPEMLLHLPFPTTWLEFGNVPPPRESMADIWPKRWGFLMQEWDDEIRLSTDPALIWNAWLFARDHVEWRLLGTGIHLYRTQAGGVLLVCDQDAMHGPFKLRTHLAQLAVRFLSTVNCCNVSRVKSAPTQKIQTARRRKGKHPIFSYWTLRLEPAPDPCSANAGGTHASPRLHLRRQHRRGRNGKFWLVRAHVVGRKELGMVHKDYDASALMKAAS